MTAPSLRAGASYAPECSGSTRPRGRAGPGPRWSPLGGGRGLSRGVPARAGPLGLPSPFGDGADGPKSSWLVPSSLVGRVKPADAASAPGPLTVYTVRLITSFDRGSALSDPNAGVSVCLVAADGRALLHRVPPVNDPQETLRSMDELCAIVTDEVGANCVVAASSPPPAFPAGKEPVPRPRFQEGARDEVSVLAPELGPLAAVMVAPEGGSWTLEEVNVSSSRTGAIERFVCRRQLGGRRGEAAAYLTPVPPGAVVYGSGEAARILTKEQAAALRIASLSDYSDLKQRLLLATALLAAGGSGIAALASGPAAAVPFALGGCAGLAYQYLLQVGADTAVASAAVAARAAAAPEGTDAAAAAEPDAGAFGGARRALGSGPLRFAALALAALSAASALVQQRGGDAVPASRAAGESLSSLVLGAPGAEAWQFGCAALGFLMYKVAILGVGMAPGGGTAAGEAAGVVQFERNERKAS
ncbi:hypothetical protein Rsub_00345 [Raphidocelis subcapitata]|uniref:DUF7755 domain-containing protein n=1 Tax=Raphidocelis subcapitata TaxID=307507 RepID=A0A2V0NK35_9CHLO|nr:hypothetical protein Rsub_00345 [Raphidocelis subcapitata]|eukprot:GBF87634.1 hypothetical protein Rsub_00345 [Raphidocelis subcapitata]